jgi:hypothetical protein
MHYVRNGSVGSGDRTVNRHSDRLLGNAVMSVFKGSGRTIPLGSFSSRLVSLMQAWAVEG